MAMIKSALEIAMERSKDLKFDEAALQMTELRQSGKKAAGRFLENPEDVDLAAIVQELPKERRDHFRQGVFEVLAAQLQLPTNDLGLEKIETVGKGFASLSASRGGLLGGVTAASVEKNVKGLCQQLAGFFRQYLEDMKNVEQAIRKQWAPRLREKEREMAARMGHDVRLDPMADPEFAAFYKQNVSAVRQQYQAALDKASAELAAMLGIERD